jgi:hypothetical protein
MDQFNCSFMYFTDSIMRYNAQSGKECDQSVIAWVVLGTLIVAARIYASIWHFQIWRAREQDRMQKQIESGAKTPGRLRNDKSLIFRTRLPIVPLLSFMEALSQLCFFIVVSLNVASTRDGSSGFAISIIMIFSHLIAYVYLRRMVKLGRRLVPLSRKKLASGNMNTTRMKNLGTFDRILTLMFYLAFLSSVSACICFLLGYAAFPGDFELFRGAAVCLSLFQTFANLSAVYQFERCIGAIKEILATTPAIMVELKVKPEAMVHSDNSTEQPTSNSSTTPPQATVSLANTNVNKNRGDQSLNLVIANMRKQQVVLVLIGWLSQLALSLGYAIEYLPMWWEIVLLQLFQNLLFTVLFGLAMGRGKPKSKKSRTLGASVEEMSKPQGKTTTGENGIVSTNAPIPLAATTSTEAQRQGRSNLQNAGSAEKEELSSSDGNSMSNTFS